MYLVALWAVIHRWYAQACIPAVREKWTPPMFFFSPGTFVLPVLLLLLPMLVLVDQHLGPHAPARSLGTFSSLVLALPSELVGRYLRFRDNSSRMLGLFRSQHLGPRLGVQIFYIHHVGVERMTVDLHRLFWHVEFDSSCFNSRLDLLAKHPALASIM